MLLQTSGCMEVVKMEAEWTSDTLASYHTTTQHQKPEELNLIGHYWFNFNHLQHSILLHNCKPSYKLQFCNNLLFHVYPIISLTSNILNKQPLRKTCHQKSYSTTPTKNRELTDWPMQSPSWEANSHSASQEIPSLLWNTKIHYAFSLTPVIQIQ
jgi:hypothetical protein